MKRYLLICTLACALLVPQVIPSHAAAVTAPLAAPSVLDTTALNRILASQLPRDPLANLAVSGRVHSLTSSSAARGAFNGRVTIQNFAVQHGKLVANVSVAGTMTSAKGIKTAVTVRTSVTAAVTGTCQVLTLTLGPLHLNLLGLVVDLNQVTLTITGERGPGKLLGNLVCGLADLLNGTTTAPAARANALNRWHGLVLQRLAPMIATIAAGPGNTLVEQVAISGTVVATATATLSATCQILTLDLGALHLDLLGLVIDLTPVHLSITAQPGHGKLLGNLLCDIANLLNGGNMSGVAGKLNQLLSLLHIHLLPLPTLLL